MELHKTRQFFIFFIILLFSSSIVNAAPDLRIVDAETSVQSHYPAIQLSKDYAIANINDPVDFVVPVKNQGTTSTTGMNYSIQCRAETDGFVQENIPFLSSEVIDPGEQVNIDFSCTFNPHDDLDGTEVRIRYPNGIGDAHSFHIYPVNPDESVPIKEDYFFVLGGSYLLSYSGADSPSFQDPHARFRDEVSGASLKFSVDSNGGGTISIGGKSYKFAAASSTTDSDYDIQVDLNGDGTIKGATVIPEEPAYDGTSVTHTLDEGDSKEYDLNGAPYNIKVLFVGSNTAKFQVVFEITDSLQEGETYYLENGGRIKLLDISYDGSAGGIRNAKFQFISPEDPSSTPDLKISEFAIEPNPEKDIAGESFKGKIVITNVGNEITRCIKNCYNKGHELYNGRIPLVIQSSSPKIVIFDLPFKTKIGEFFSIEPLKPGESREINILINSFVSTEPGTYSVTIDAGALLEIGSYVTNEQEKLLGDNRYTKEFKIGQDDTVDSSKPDLRIVDAEASVQSHYPAIQLSKDYAIANINDPVNFVVPVKNQGNTSTTGMNYSIQCRAETDGFVQEDIPSLSSEVIDPDEKILIDFSCTFNPFDEIDEAEISISYPDGLSDSHNFKLYVVNPDKSEPIAKDYHFVLGGKHLLRYDGADRPEVSNAEARFRDMVTGAQIKVPVSSDGGSINIGGNSYKFVAAGSTIDSDYDIRVDINGDSTIEGATVVIEECETDLDCNDDNACTSDVCSSTPKKCSNRITGIGCNLNDNCVPIGTRTEAQFCDVNKSMTNQNSDDASCNNNYECTSNVCINNKCIEPNFIQKIINWFIKLFGG